MAIDRLINSTQGDSIISELDSIATKIQGINRDINLPSNQIVSMAGYSEPANTSAIATTDTLNEAVGKLERKADNEQDKTVAMSAGGEDYIVINGIRVYVSSTAPSSTAPEGSLWIG